MARITMLTPDQLDPELRRRSRADERSSVELGPTRILGHQPEMAAGLLRSVLTQGQPHVARPADRARAVAHRVPQPVPQLHGDPIPGALDDGLTEDLVCSLERPMESDDLDDRERLAIRYGELFATNHLALDDAFHDRLRELFTEPEIVELGLNVALFVGVGRLSATWDMVDDLPDRYAPGEVTPWGADDAIVVR